MMKTAVTLCRVAEAAAGPFVFHDELDVGFALAAAHGFDAVELFLPGPDAVEVTTIRGLCEEFGLAIAAVGTGAGKLRHGLTLTDPDAGKRAAAGDFLEEMIRFGGRLGAPAILGSMQGSSGGGVSHELALEWLAAALARAGRVAAGSGVPFLYEPLNRYETNLFNRQQPAADFLRHHSLDNVKLLADLFHMNLEESDPAAALRAAGEAIGHVHWADSNRRAMGAGHTDPAPLAQALHEIGYQGYLSAEILPLPDAATAAAGSIRSMHAAIGKP